jgi:TetR/AcrR family transcriptional regulator, regulator of autoinduction and epiphytic fitness
MRERILMSREDFIKTRAAAKRADILSAARARFARDGYERASTEKIAGDARVSTATLFRQFPTKLDLFSAVMSDGLGAFDTRLAEASALPPLERLTVLAHAYGQLLDQPETAGIMRAILAAAPTSPDVAAAFYERVKSVIAGSFQETASQLHVAGLLVLPDGPAVPVGQLMGMIEHVTLWRRMLSSDPVKVQIAPLVDAALDSFWTKWGVVKV